MSDADADRFHALLRAWLAAEGMPSAQADRVAGFEQGHGLLSAPGAARAHPSVAGDSSWLRLWSALPAGARDLIALRVLAGLPLARIAALQGRPTAHVEREWLLLGRRLSARDPAWPAALRADLLAWNGARPTLPDSERPDHRGLRAALGVAALACFIAAYLAPQIHYAWLLDPAQQRLQAPPAAPPPVIEAVPLSAPDFALWADAIEFETLQSLDFLLWRLIEGGGEVVFVDSTPSARLTDPAPNGQADGAAPMAPSADPGAAEVAAEDSIGTAAAAAEIATAHAAGAAAPSPMPALSALAPWALQWPHLLPAQRIELEQRAQQWEQMDAAARARFELRAQRFRELPPMARASLRERHARWLDFDAATRSTLRALEVGFGQAEAAQREVLRAQFEALPEAVRRGLLAGKSPELAELAREAFAFVPEEEREATVALLRGLDEAEHSLLRRMARRLDAPARESLRSALLAAEPDARAGLIRERAATVGLRAE
jgi:hypothetical protein